MRTPIYRAGTREKLGEINPKSLIYDGDVGAMRIEDAVAPYIVSWMEECRDGLGNCYLAIFQFSMAETEAAGGEPERLPWDHKHLDRVELSED